MSSTTLLLVIVSIGLLTFAMRFSVIGLAGRMQLPKWLLDGLRFVPPAVLSAIIWPTLLLRNGILSIDLDNSRLIAGMIAIATALLTKNIFATLGVGMASLWLLGWVRP